MSQGSDNNNSSDDLIAELARLMASDARGEAEPKVSDSPVVDTPTPAEQVSARPVEFDENPASAAAEHPAPSAAYTPTEPVFEAPSDEGAAPDQFADRPDPEISTHAEPVEFERTSPALSHPDETHEEERPAPRFTPPTTPSDSFSEPPSSRSVSKDEFEFQLPPLKPLDDLNFGEEAASHRRSAEPTFHIPQTEPVFEQEPEQFETEAYAPDPAPGEFAQESASQPEDIDPIAALIAAQLNEADAVQPGMIRSRYTPSPEPSITRAPSRDFGARHSAGGIPRSSRDPLDDIESLIGAALRGEQAAPQNAQPAHVEPAFEHPAPIQQPNTIGVADSAEAAILAATASMRRRNDEGGTDDFGHAQSGNLDPQFSAASELRSRNATSRKPRPAWQKFAGPAVAAALLIAVGLGVYWIFGVNGQVDEDAPVLSADSGPVKQAPEATSTDTPNSVVFSDSANSGSDTIERLISRDETTDVAGNDVSRVITAETADDGGLANRKVRTVTVRPDGTIVSGDAAVAGGEQLPVDRPNVPVLPGATIVEAPVATTQVATQTAPANSTVSEAVAPVPLPRPNRPATTPVSAPVAAAPVVSTSVSGNTNAVDLIANTANSAVRAPAAPVVQQPAPSFAVASGSSAPAYVQLSSQRNPDAAQQSLQRVQSRFAPQLGNNALEVQQVDLGERGIYYRVRMPAQSVETANTVCANIKSAGGDCFVRTD